MRSNDAISIDKIEAIPRLAIAPLLSKGVQGKILVAGLLVCDAFMLGLAFLLAFWLRFRAGFALEPHIVPDSTFYPQLIVILIPLWLVLFAAFGLYNQRFLLNGVQEYSRAFNACTLGIMLVIVATFLDPTLLIARGWLVTSWVLSCILIFLGRFSIRRTGYALRKWGLFVRRAAIVGANGEAQALADQLADWRASGLCILGFVSTNKGIAKDYDSRQVLGSVDEIENLVKALEIQELIVATSDLDRACLLELFERTNLLPDVEMRLSSGLFEVLTTGVEVTTMGFVPLMSLRKMRLDPLEGMLKTGLEYGLTIPALILLSPLFLVIALLIRLDSPGPVFHRRRVLGVGGKEFDAFKFRTMYCNGDELLQKFPEKRRQLQTEGKLKDDPRITRIGTWLRKYSLDELPQLWNVVMGQMSLVGPRMISPEESEKYDRHKMNLLTVKPGITGLWQVSGRSDLDYARRVQLDMYYIRNYTIWRDLQILFVQTIPAVFKGKGAY